MLESVPKLLIFIDFSIHSSIKHIVFIMCLQQALTSIWQIHCLSFFFSLGYLGCLLFNMNFRICSVSVKNHIEVLVKIVSNICNNFGNVSIYENNLSLFIQIYLFSFSNIFPFSQYSSWTNFVLFNPRNHAGFVAILNRKSFSLIFFSIRYCCYVRTFWVLLICGDLVLLAYKSF